MGIGKQIKLLNFQIGRIDKLGFGLNVCVCVYFHFPFAFVHIAALVDAADLQETCL